MPPRKGAGKRKRDKAKAVQQKKAQLSQLEEDLNNPLLNAPCNGSMTCDECGLTQRNRAFCYFCHAVQRLPQCGECGRYKCLGIGDCVVKHGSSHVTGLKFVGAVCDYCETWICHSKECLSTHACNCPLCEYTDQGYMPIKCQECHRTVWECGGSMFQCPSCKKVYCEEDHFEHEAMCQTLEMDDDKCISCGKRGQWTCLRCKINYCDIHVKQIFKLAPGEPFKCKRCRYELRDTSTLSLSVRKHEFGRQQRTVKDNNNSDSDDDYENGESSHTDDNYNDNTWGTYSDSDYHDSDNYSEEEENNSPTDNDNDNEEEEEEDNSQ
ncbi:hypothetical protein WA158_007901 [Blastocystis sp. Blastoise]